ncbi:MAG: hypothetical protein JSS27_02105 [Planctomycetes bacterium]|nr:hypothetical protein [Planctomycetota bacterium]
MPYQQPAQLRYKELAWLSDARADDAVHTVLNNPDLHAPLGITDTDSTRVSKQIWDILKEGKRGPLELDNPGVVDYARHHYESPGPEHEQADSGAGPKDDAESSFEDTPFGPPVERAGADERAATRATAGSRGAVVQGERPGVPERSAGYAEGTQLGPAWRPWKSRTWHASMGSFIDAASKSAAHAPRQAVDLGQVTADQVQAISTAANGDVSGFHHVLDGSAYRHILAEHGSEQERLRGQEPIGDADFERLPEILASPDRVTAAGVSNLGQPLIRYEKRFNGTTYYVEEVRQAKNELAAKSLWKRKTPPPPVDPTSETTRHGDRATHVAEEGASPSIGQRPGEIKSNTVAGGFDLRKFAADSVAEGLTRSQAKAKLQRLGQGHLRSELSPIMRELMGVPVPKQNFAQRMAAKQRANSETRSDAQEEAINEGFEETDRALRAAGATLDKESDSGSRYYTLAGRKIRVADHEATAGTRHWLDNQDDSAEIRVDQRNWQAALDQAIHGENSTTNEVGQEVKQPIKVNHLDVARAIIYVKQKYGIELHPKEATGDIQEDLQYLAKSFGAIPVFFEDSNGRLKSPFRLGKAIFLPHNATDAALTEATMHEVFHATGIDQDPAFDDEYVKQWSDYYEKRLEADEKNGSPVASDMLQAIRSNPELRRSEGIATMGGKFFLDPKFQKKLRSDKPTLAERLEYAIRKIFGLYTPMSEAMRVALDRLRGIRAVVQQEAGKGQPGEWGEGSSGSDSGSSGSDTPLGPAVKRAGTDQRTTLGTAQGSVAAVGQGQRAGVPERPAGPAEGTQLGPPVVIKGDELGDPSDPEKFRETVYEYAMSHFRGHPFINLATKTPVFFSRNGLRKIKSFSGDIRRMQLLAKAPELIERAEYVDSAPADEPGYDRFHYFRVPVEIAGHRDVAHLTFAQDKNGHWYYWQLLESDQAEEKEKARHPNQVLGDKLPSGPETSGPSQEKSIGSGDQEIKPKASSSEAADGETNLGPRLKEAGQQVGSLARHFLTSRGDLPQEAFIHKEQMAQFETAQDISTGFALRDFKQAMKREYGGELKAGDPRLLALNTALHGGPVGNIPVAMRGVVQQMIPRRFSFPRAPIRTITGADPRAATPRAASLSHRTHPQARTP